MCFQPLPSLLPGTRFSLNCCHHSQNKLANSLPGGSRSCGIQGPPPPGSNFQPSLPWLPSTTPSVAEPCAPVQVPLCGLLCEYTTVPSPSFTILPRPSHPSVYLMCLLLTRQYTQIFVVTVLHCEYPMQRSWLSFNSATLYKLPF